MHRYQKSLELLLPLEGEDIGSVWLGLGQASLALYLYITREKSILNAAIHYYRQCITHIEAEADYWLRWSAMIGLIKALWQDETTIPNAKIFIDQLLQEISHEPCNDDHFRESLKILIAEFV